MSLGELPFARRNYNLLVGDVSLFLIAIAFLDTATVFPVLVERLGGNSALIGGVLTLRQALMFLPPIFVAHRLRGRTRYLSPLIRICVLGRLWLMVAGWVVLREGIAHQTLALIALIVAYLLLWLSDGMGLVPWMAIVGRSVPAERRGRLFATTTIVSAFAKFGVGELVKRLLSGNFLPFPASIALLPTATGVGMMLSAGFLAGMKEPPAAPVPVRENHSLRDYLRQLPGLLRSRPDLGRLALVQILAGSLGASMPFLVGYTGRGEELAGPFLIAQNAGLLLFAPLWGWLTDWKGPRLAILGLLGMALLAPLTALSGNITFYFVAYFCYGAALDGWSVFTNYLLDSIHKNPESTHEETTYIALMNVASAPVLLLPMLMGFAAQRFTPVASFSLTLLLLLLGLAVARRLPETRSPAA